VTKRIAIVSEHASPLAVLGGVDGGGQNLYVGQLALHLGRIGYEVDVFTRREAPAMPEIVEWAPSVRVVHVPAGPPESLPKEDLLPFMGAFTDLMQAFIEERRGSYDIVHANFFMSGLVAADLKRRIGIPFVVTFHALGKVRRLHQGDADRFPDERFEIERRIVHEADHVIAECPQDEEDLIRLYNADPVRVSVIPAGFDPAELSPVGREQARAALGLPVDERIVLHVGRMVPRKGVDNLIRGFARLTRTMDAPLRLIVVGGDSQRPDPEREPELRRLMSIAADEHVSGFVTFTGRVQRDRLRYYYCAADVFVTTPWYEPFGITPLEAMGCGTPVIGSNVGGIKFSVRDGETGYLVPPRDPDALADKLHQLLRDSRVLTVFRSQAVRRVHAMFTWRHVVSQVAALYERLLSGDRLDRMVRGDDYARVERSFVELAEALQISGQVLPDALVGAADAIGSALARGNKIMICGNGDGAVESQRLAEELGGRVRGEDRPAPAMSLASDTSAPTAWSDDVSCDDVFARQVRALGRPGDVLVGISASGHSPNVVRAFQNARHRGILCIGLLGGDGGVVRRLSDLAVVVPVAERQRIQEVQLLVVHLLSELVEERMADWAVATSAVGDDDEVRLVPAPMAINGRVL
jgi:D-inositol-3-phosphate glycosyltransferase